MAIFRSRKWLLTALMLLSSTATLADDSVSSAIKRLSTVESFAFGGVGYAGVISKGEIDFKFILAQPQSTALDAFETLYRTGNPQSKAYALAGIKQLNPARFREILGSLENSGEEVQVMRGCIVSQESLLAVAKQIDREKFHF